MTRRTPDGSGYWLGWLSPLPLVWLWHAMFDGTPLCRCQHSHDYRAIARRVAGEYPRSERSGDA